MKGFLFYFFKVANAELKEAQNAKNLFEEELKHATDLSSSLGQEKQSLQEEVAVLQARTKELQESLINAGKALDDSIQEKDELERNFHAQLREGEMKLEKERQQFENEMSNTRQQTELLQQSSEAALFKVFNALFLVFYLFSSSRERDNKSVRSVINWLSKKG